MAAAELPASSGSQELVDDFFSTVEEMGLTDIAKEVGLPSGRVAEVSMDAGLASELVGGGAGPSSLAADSQLSASQNGESSQGGASASPPRVHMPQCTTAGPSVPSELQDMVSAAGDGPASKKKRLQRTGGKQGDKGLRHFSMKVCEKVEQKNRTTYNEVADELVAEFTSNPDGHDLGVDSKGQKVLAGGEAGIRRRVYDALNVLMAMDIITKEKKSILWRGLPTNTEQEGHRLQMDLSTRSERTDRKRQHLQDLVSQQVSFRQLIERNRQVAVPDNRISLPFIVVNTRKETVIDCEMAEDRQEIFFNFSAPFEIHDDSETLKRMEMQRCPPESVAALVPEGLGTFAAEMLAAQEAAAGAPAARGAAQRNGSRK